MIISIDAEKAFDKLNILCDKNPPESRHRRNILQHNKKPYTTHPQQILSSMAKKLKAFPLKSGKRQGCPLSPLLFNIVLEVLATIVREEKK